MNEVHVIFEPLKCTITSITLAQLITSYEVIALCANIVPEPVLHI